MMMIMMIMMMIMMIITINDSHDDILSGLQMLLRTAPLVVDPDSSSAWPASVRLVFIIIVAFVCLSVCLFAAFAALLALVVLQHALIVKQGELMPS